MPGRPPPWRSPARTPGGSGDNPPCPGTLHLGVTGVKCIALIPELDSVGVLKIEKGVIGAAFDHYIESAADAQIYAIVRRSPLRPIPVAPVGCMNYAGSRINAKNGGQSVLGMGNR